MILTTASDQVCYESPFHSLSIVVILFRQSIYYYYHHVLCFAFNIPMLLYSSFSLFEPFLHCLTNNVTTRLLRHYYF